MRECVLALLVALAELWQCAAAQRVLNLAASTCSACVATNGASIYSDTSGGGEDPQTRGVYCTGIGIPTVVWCSPDPTGSSGACKDSTFIVANLQTQCSGWTSPAQASPCPASAPYAFFQKCDCTRTCAYQGLAFDGFGSPPNSKQSSGRSIVPEANAVNLLRSCDLCVAAGGEWWSASDLTSSSCSNVTLMTTIEDVNYEFTQTVVPSCHVRGQRFVSVTADFVLAENVFKPAFRYTSSYQCSHGSSFCSSINLPGANCVAMIVLLSNFPFTAVYMCFGRFISTGFKERSDGTVKQTIFYLCAIFLVFASCDPATPLAR